GVVVPVVVWIQAGAAEPVTATAVTHVGQPVGHRSQQYWVEPVTGASWGCLTRGASFTRWCLTWQQMIECGYRMVAVVQVDNTADRILTMRLCITRSDQAQALNWR